MYCGLALLCGTKELNRPFVFPNQVRFGFGVVNVSLTVCIFFFAMSIQRQ